MRHGSTDWNSDEQAPERFRGTSNIDLNTQGIQEARDAGTYLKSQGVKVVYTDNIKRTEHTGQIIADIAGAKHVVQAELRQWELGDLTGKPVKEEMDTLNNYATKTPDKPLPGGESFNKWKETYLTALDKIFETAQKDRVPFAIVVHAVDSQLDLASYAAPGGFSNHDIDPATFVNYSAGAETGDIIKLDYTGGQWKIKDGEASSNR